jgi:hypothetical protein
LHCWIWLTKAGAVNNVARTVARKGGGKPADRKCPGAGLVLCITYPSLTS